MVLRGLAVHGIHPRSEGTGDAELRERRGKRQAAKQRLQPLPPPDLQVESGKRIIYRADRILRPIQGDFPEAAWKLKPGDISPPVRTAVGYHLIRLIAHRKAQVPTFEAVVERVREDYYGERVRLESQQWLRDLVQKARITKRLAQGMAEWLQTRRTAADGDRLAAPRGPHAGTAPPAVAAPRAPQKKPAATDKFVPYE